MAPKKLQPTNNPPKIIKKGRVTKTERAGVIFPVGRVQRHLREGKFASRIQTGAAVYMAGVLEYLSAEILEISADVSAANKKSRINPRHVMTAIKSDAELSELLKDVTIPYAGVVPYIHETLLPKNSKKKNPKEVEIGELMEAETEQENEENEERVQTDVEEEEGTEEEGTEEEEEMVF